MGVLCAVGCVPLDPPVLADQQPKPESEPEPAPAPAPKPAQTALVSPVPAGATTLPVRSQDGFKIGDIIVIDKGTPIEEWNKVVGYGSLLLESPLRFDHAANALVGVDSAVTSGTTASLDAAGFKAVTSLCCPSETEQFFNRLLDSLGYDVCSFPHIQGLMHWFSCVPDMDFQYLLDVIANGNPCKYWTPKGQTCPKLSAQCMGHDCNTADESLQVDSNKGESPAATEAPTTAASTAEPTVAPATVAPTTEAPTTVAPSTIIPTEQPTAEPA